MSDKHSVDWPGYPLVTQARRLCYVGQRSGLLFADEIRGDKRRFVQDPDESPAKFWERVVKAVGINCPTCHRSITEVATA